MSTIKFSAIRKLFSEYVFIIFTVIIIFISIRLLEYLFILIEGSNDISFNLLVSRSINFDTLFVINVSLIFLFPILSIGLINNRAAKTISRIIGFVFILIHLILTSYFLVSWNILSDVVFEFSLRELLKTVVAEFTFSNFTLWIGFIAMLMASAFLLFNFTNRIFIKKKTGLILISIYLVFGAVAIKYSGHTFKASRYFDTNFQFLVGNSKEVFFIKSLEYKNSSYDFNSHDINETAQRYQNKNLKVEYCSTEYPFLHNASYENVLGKYFYKDTIPPNIVVVESLSSSFSGKCNSINGSLTPFIDSLAEHSLYWENFFSNAERSFGVLPNVLASLPYGTIKRGFINMDNEYANFEKYPRHTSLIKLLNENNYRTNFFYGRWGYFDNVGYFMKANNITHFVTEDDFDTKNFKKADGKESWGYNDKDLFAQSFKLMEGYDKGKGYLNIYQTLSLHGPYNLCERRYYTKEYLENKIDQLKLNPANTEIIPKEILSSIFFTDDALKYLFSESSKRENFLNTIFIITGDHGIDLHLKNDIFEKFRVPLIIYSPMLKQSATFKGLCSHIDILPSILALLQDNFNLKFPQQNHWIGQGLDTSEIFNAKRNIPLSIYSHILPNYIAENHVIFEDKVIRFDSLFTITNETNLNKINAVEELFEDYSFLNNYVCVENKIWPE